VIVANGEIVANSFWPGAYILALKDEVLRAEG
jgi:hypothetical protein